MGRKDDLESLGYMLLFLLKGTLPWSNIQASSDHDKMKQVGAMKISMDTGELCKEVPVEFARFLLRQMLTQWQVHGVREEVELQATTRLPVLAAFVSEARCKLEFLTAR
jgi:hypothetical protein